MLTKESLGGAIPGMPLFNPAHNSRDAELLESAIREVARVPLDANSPRCRGGGGRGDALPTPRHTTGRPDEFWRALMCHAHFDPRARFPPCSELPAASGSNPALRRLQVNRTWYRAYLHAWDTRYPISIRIEPHPTGGGPPDCPLPHITLSAPAGFLPHATGWPSRSDGGHDSSSSSSSALRVTITASGGTHASTWDSQAWGLMCRAWEAQQRCSLREVAAELNGLLTLVESSTYKEEVVVVHSKRAPAEVSFGFSVSTYDLILVRVIPGSPAARSGMGQFIGRKLISIDGSPITSPEHAGEICTSRLSITLRLGLVKDGGKPSCGGCTDLQDRVNLLERRLEAQHRHPKEWWPDHRRVCGACGESGIMPWAERCPGCGSDVQEGLHEGAAPPPPPSSSSAGGEVSSGGQRQGGGGSPVPGLTPEGSSVSQGSGSGGAAGLLRCGACRAVLMPLSSARAVQCSSCSALLSRTKGGGARQGGRPQQSGALSGGARQGQGPRPAPPGSTPTPFCPVCNIPVEGGACKLCGRRKGCSSTGSGGGGGVVT